MIVTTLLRAFAGTVELQVSGGYPERFLNLLNRNRIGVWDLRKEGSCLFLRMARRDYTVSYTHLKSSRGNGCGQWDTLPGFPGRADGLRNRRLPCLRMQDKAPGRKRNPFSCMQRRPGV